MIDEAGDDVLLRVRVQPRARRNEIAGPRDQELVVRVSAPPADGQANEAVLRTLAKALGLPRGRVAIERGHNSRHKIVRVSGIAPREVLSRLSS